jgi:hypothetical protein
MFHVKHFWNHSNFLWSEVRLQPESRWGQALAFFYEFEVW